MKNNLINYIFRQFNGILVGAAGAALFFGIYQNWNNIRSVISNDFPEQAKLDWISFFIYLVTLAIIAVLVFLVFWGKNTNSIGLFLILPRTRKRNVSELAKMITGSLDYWGISGKSIFDTEEYRRKLLKQLKSGYQVRILLMNPESKNLARRANNEGANLDAWKKDIGGTIDKLRELKKSYNNLEGKITDIYPIWRLMTFANKEMMVTWYPNGKRAYYSHQFFLTNTGDTPLYYAFNQEFSEAWDDGEKI